MNDQSLTDASWWRTAVVYQVYPRSFADSNADGVGDLRGICDRISYISDLGVDAIWLSPFYPSPQVDGGYDVADFRDVDPLFGTLDDFDDLVQTAHAHGLRAIVDIVPNHTSDQHPWFQEARAAAPYSAARDRYLFRDGAGPDGSAPPSDWRSEFGGSAWSQLPDGQWYLHVFAAQQPDLNWENEEVRADFRDTLRFWSDRGVDGFRVDVAHGLAKDLSTPYLPQTLWPDPLPSDGSDPLSDRDAVHDIYRDWRRVLNEYSPPKAAVAEASVHPLRRSLYSSPDGLGQAFNFDLLDASWSADGFRDSITTNLEEADRAGTSSTWVLENHDVLRAPSRYGLPNDLNRPAWLLSDGTNPRADEELGLERARAAMLLLLALPGSTYLYQGQELGLSEVADLPGPALQDPTWQSSGHTDKGRDGCRIPMPWNSKEPALGFTRGIPWLPQPERFRTKAVDAQQHDPHSTLALTRRALEIRRTLNTDHGLRWLPSPNEEVLHFQRGDAWRCMTNFSSQPVPLPTIALLTSGPAEPSGSLPPNTTAWFGPLPD